jgi:hypothetical protein
MKCISSAFRRGVIPALAFLSLVAGAEAQTLSGVTVGDELTAVGRMGAKPLPGQVFGYHEVQRWRMPDGNTLSVTDDKTGRIVYAEEKWGGAIHGKPADFPGFAYGRTTLAEIRKHAQNNGFAFVERLIDERPDGLALYNAYEVEGKPGLVVTFVTKMSKRDAERLKSKQEVVDINRSAKLDGIILGDSRYLDSIWGQAKLKCKNYKPIHWASAQ